MKIALHPTGNPYHHKTGCRRITSGVGLWRGIGCPGDMLGTFPSADEELERQCRTLFANLRFEVARIQPTPRYVHRHPQVLVPIEIKICEYVFVRWGSVTTPLTSPYDGPFRVVVRTPQEL